MQLSLSEVLNRLLMSQLTDIGWTITVCPVVTRCLRILYITSYLHYSTACCIVFYFVTFHLATFACKCYSNISIISFQVCNFVYNMSYTLSAQLCKKSQSNAMILYKKYYNWFIYVMSSNGLELLEFFL